MTKLLNNLEESKKDPYQIVKELDLVGLYTIVYVKTSYIKYVTKFDYQIIKTGFKGTLGNKGSLLFRFNIHDSTIAMACNHLSSGQDYQENRKSEIINVLKTEFKKYSKEFKDYDYYFYFGDLNIRLDLNLNDFKMRDLIQNYSKETKRDFSQILKYDQLYKSKNEDKMLFDMEEAEIKFSPTYKYYIGRPDYDTSTRIPSWCDRILYKKSSNITPLSYNKAILKLSDHQPVYGLYRIKTEEIDKSKKQMIMTEIIKEKAQNIRGYERKTELSNGDIEENFFS
jgi:hypothetical protein